MQVLKDLEIAYQLSLSYYEKEELTELEYIEKIQEEYKYYTPYEIINLICEEIRNK